MAQEERVRRDVHEVDDKVNHHCTAACEGTAMKMLNVWEDSEVMKVSTRALKERVLCPDESSVNIVRIARQARSEMGKKLFHIFRPGEKEVVIVGVARWEKQLKGLVVLERHCLALREEVKHLSERQEVLAVLMEGKKNMQMPGAERSV